MARSKYSAQKSQRKIYLSSRLLTTVFDPASACSEPGVGTGRLRYLAGRAPSEPDFKAQNLRAEVTGHAHPIDFSNRRDYTGMKDEPNRRTANTTNTGERCRRPSLSLHPEAHERALSLRLKVLLRILTR